MKYVKTKQVFAIIDRWKNLRSLSKTVICEVEKHSKLKCWEQSGCACCMGNYIKEALSSN